MASARLSGKLYVDELTHPPSVLIVVVSSSSLGGSMEERTLGTGDIVRIFTASFWMACQHAQQQQ